MSERDILSDVEEMKRIESEEITPDEYLILNNHLTTEVTDLTNSLEHRQRLYSLYLKIKKLCNDRGYFEL